MSETTDLIARLRDNAQGISLGAEGMGWGFDEAMLNEAADVLEQQAAQIAEKDAEITRLRDIARDAADAATKHQSIVLTQAAQIEALQLTKAGLIGSLREEMDEGLRLRELGGALPDENITAMTERLIGERAALAAELSALRADAERLRAALQIVREYQDFDAGGPLPEMMDQVLRGEHSGMLDFLDRLDAALRQEQPTPLVEIGRRTTPCGECHLQPGECCDICGARDVSAQPAGEVEK